MDVEKLTDGRCAKKRNFIPVRQKGIQGRRHKDVRKELEELAGVTNLLWAPAQRKWATMLYFANVLFIYFFMAALFSGPG